MFAIMGCAIVSKKATCSESLPFVPVCQVSDSGFSEQFVAATRGKTRLHSAGTSVRKHILCSSCVSHPTRQGSASKTQSFTFENSNCFPEDLENRHHNFHQFQHVVLGVKRFRTNLQNLDASLKSFASLF